MVQHKPFATLNAINIQRQKYPFELFYRGMRKSNSCYRIRLNHKNYKNSNSRRSMSYYTGQRFWQCDTIY